MRLDLFPLNTVLFPRMRLPLHIFEPRYRAMIRDCIEHERPFGVVLIRSGDEVGDPAEPHDMGTTARIVRHETLGEGRMNIETSGEERFHIDSVDQTTPHLVATVTVRPMPMADPREATALAADVRKDYREAIGLMLELQGAFDANMPLPRNPEHFAYFVASALPADSGTRQQLLESDSVDALLSAEARLVEQLVRGLRKRLEDQQTTRLN